MPWIVYETTNTVNGKRYIGVHKQDADEFDGYLGSGKHLANAVAKYGRENFAWRPLFSFESEQDAYAREAEIVTEGWCKRKDNYNIKTGGSGGFPHNDPEFRDRHSARMKALHSDPEFRDRNSAATKAYWVRYRISKASALLASICQ